MSRPTPVSTFVAVALLASMSLGATLTDKMQGDQSSVASGPNAAAVSPNPEVQSRIAACIGRSSSGVRNVQECLSAIVKQRQQGNAIDDEKYKTTYKFGPQSWTILPNNPMVNRDRDRPKTPVENWEEKMKEANEAMDMVNRDLRKEMEAKIKEGQCNALCKKIK